MSTQLNNKDYIERVYAAVLGKIIGVYLGRPIEGWTYKRIMSEIGEIKYYINKKFNLPIVLTDDDICGTFTFLRTIADNNYDLGITPDQIGQSLLNYLIEDRTVFWWGGFGNSTEHTAYLRLKNGVKAPMSGSIKLNGKIVAESIGAQIFIDGWALISPGDPELAADLAKRGASVTHDGEAIYAAQVIAAMESYAFIESNINKLLDTAVNLIPKNTFVYKLIDDIRMWHAKENNWHKTRELIEKNYGCEKFPGNFHIIPNHGLIILGLLYGNGDFQKSLTITNTSGWDTDCNSGNLGCLLGIRNGLACFERGLDWRGPVRDRLYLSTADGGRAITDAVAETYNIVNIYYRINCKNTVNPKNGAKFHFELPGSVQGFYIDQDSKTKAVVKIENVKGHSKKGLRSLAIYYKDLNPNKNFGLATQTFMNLEAANMPPYMLMSSPTLYSGQIIKMGISADPGNKHTVISFLYIKIYNSNDDLIKIYGPQIELVPGTYREVSWKVVKTNGLPIAEIGIGIKSNNSTSGVIYLDYLTWGGSPDIVLKNQGSSGNMWYRAWVNGFDKLILDYSKFFRVVQNNGTGLLIHGSNDWKDYQITAIVKPYLAKSFGICARVQGMRRYYALLLCNDGVARLIKASHTNKTLSKSTFGLDFGKKYDFSIKVNKDKIIAKINNNIIFKIKDNDNPLLSGGIALICEEGCIDINTVKVEPIK